MRAKSLGSLPAGALVLVSLTRDVIDLRNAYLAAGILDPQSTDDATHGAAATVAVVYFLGSHNGQLDSNTLLLSGIVSGLTMMAHTVLGGLFMIIGSLIGMVIGVIFSRIISEFVLIMFRINEHLGAIRQRGQM